MSGPGRFELCRLAELPTMLDGPNGRGCASALGAAQDNEQALLTDAVLMRYPPRTPGDGLDHLGADSLIERFEGEADGSAVPPTGYQGRLIARWKTWKKAGSAQALIDSLNAYGITDVAVYQDFDTTLTPGEWYSRFYVIIGPLMPWTPMVLGTWVLGDPGTLGSSALVKEVEAVKRQVLKWKAAHSYPVRIILDFGCVAAVGVDAVILGANGFGPLVENMVSWHIGKLFGVDTSMPFTLGGYEI